MVSILNKLFSPLFCLSVLFSVDFIGLIAKRRRRRRQGLQGRGRWAATPTSFGSSMTCFDTQTPSSSLHPLSKNLTAPTEHTHTHYVIHSGCVSNPLFWADGIITRPRRTQNCAKFGEPRVASRVADSIRKLCSPPDT